VDDSPFDFKQSIVLRTDLGMSVGKMVAQGCHAAVDSSEQAKKRKTQTWMRWRLEGGRKVVLQVESLEELEELADKADKLGIVQVLVEDRGLTEIPPGTTTALGIGPDRSDLIDKVTGNLKLLK